MDIQDVRLWNLLTPPDDLADYWVEIQESLTDELIKYKASNPELIKLMETHPYFNTMIRNLFANGWVRGNMVGAKRQDLGLKD